MLSLGACIFCAFLYVRNMFYFVYIMASRRNGTLYIGQTGDLIIRVEDHKSRQLRGFTHDYGCIRLVWFEVHDTRGSAFARERQMKKWKRVWKIAAIESLNPRWDDLSLDLNAMTLFEQSRLCEAIS